MRQKNRLLAFALLSPLMLVSRAGLPQTKTAFATDSDEQFQALAQAFKQNSYPISMVERKLRGPGSDFIVEKTRRAQFVLFGEEHNVKEFPQFLDALFGFLHESSGFNYLALENDPVSAHVASILPLRGDLNAIGSYAARYPNAFTFPTDQELEMIARAGRVSTGHADAVWGLDQSFGALHALERLRDLPSFKPTPLFDTLLAQASEFDARREGGETHYMAHIVKLAALEELRRQNSASENSEVGFILDNLVSSARIYGYYVSNQYYLNGFEREQQMKELFMLRYRAAQAAGETKPKVLVKMGHWHIFRGVGPSHLQTLGNFVTELATANGAEAFSVGVYLRGPWRDIAKSGQKGMDPIAMATDSSSWTLIDFRALRPAVSGGKFGVLNPNLISAIYGFDAALVIGGASPGTKLLLKGK